MRTLLLKNLAAHKGRNYLTSMIYALTLGCIIFLLVTASLQIQSITASNAMSGADLFLKNHVNATEAESVLYKYKDQIKDFAYISPSFTDF